MGSRGSAAKRRQDLGRLVHELRGKILELQQDLIVLGMIQDQEDEDPGDFDRDELGLDPEEDDECRG